MSNPWLKKNPYMSLWLSGANSIAGAARGQVASAARRQANTLARQAGQDMFSFWTAALSGAAATPQAKRRKKRSSSSR